eukprot:SAG31_NODE_801_length_12013_cov_23.812070_16_plen_237_part_00
MQIHDSAPVFDCLNDFAGTNTTVSLTSELFGNGHHLNKLSLAFRYAAGYSPDPEHPPKVVPEAAVVSVVLADAKTGHELATVWTSPPLGDYSFDHFTGYSPPVKVESAPGLSVPNAQPIKVLLKFRNNARNLQIQVRESKGVTCNLIRLTPLLMLPQLAPQSGLNLTVGWAADGPSPAPGPAPGPSVTPGANGVAVVRGPLVFTLHPTENMTVRIIDNRRHPLMLSLGIDRADLVP